MSRLLVVPAPRAGSLEAAASRKLLPSEALEWCATTTDGSQLVIKTKALEVVVELVPEPAPKPKAKKAAAKPKATKPRKSTAKAKKAAADKG